MGPLAEACEHFCHITDNFAAGLFHWYDLVGLPRTNTVVVRGSVRVMAAVVTPPLLFSVEELRPRDYQRWRDLRRQLQQREETRRKPWRFRKDPAAYLAALEVRLIGTLPYDAG